MPEKKNCCFFSGKQQSAIIMTEDYYLQSV